jgi:peroxidase
MVSRAAILALLLLGIINSCYGQVKIGYYKGKCGAKDIESIIQAVVKARFAYDPDIVAFLLRLQFHDCLGDKVICTD